jgi:hypothetical protein
MGGSDGVHGKTASFVGCRSESSHLVGLNGRAHLKSRVKALNAKARLDLRASEGFHMGRKAKRSHSDT